MHKMKIEVSHLAPLCKGELLLLSQAQPTIEGLSAEVMAEAERFDVGDLSVLTAEKIHCVEAVDLLLLN